MAITTVFQFAPLVKPNWALILEVSINREKEVLTINQGTAAGLAQRTGKFVKFIPADSSHCVAVLLFEKNKLIVTQLGENSNCTLNPQIPIAGTFIKVSNKNTFNPEISLADYFDKSVRYEKKRQVSLTSSNYGDPFHIVPKGENHQIYSFKGYAGQILELTIKFLSANSSVSIRGSHNLELMGKGLTENTWKLRLPEDDEYFVETNGVENEDGGSDYDITIEIDEPDNE